MPTYARADALSPTIALKSKGRVRRTPIHAGVSMKESAVGRVLWAWSTNPPPQNNSYNIQKYYGTARWTTTGYVKLHRDPKSLPCLFFHTGDVSK